MKKTENIAKISLLPPFYVKNVKLKKKEDWYLMIEIYQFSSKNDEKTTINILKA